MVLPEAKHCKVLKNQDLLSGVIPQGRALGINLNAKEDKLGFQVQLPEKPLTINGSLSILSSVYDPLGLAGSVILEGRSLIYRLCKGNFSWDERIPQNT